ncbi:enoyl-CoA hydratase/isomerase family protein [Nannocystis radixulma]|uniref:Enoyl-CoA hydratase/isomerase family protein n=1 Tax=Nannocystis radixulma TaxID=2995305 RepID=A0ABT5BM45_9BACT|nr:enoyl-CoA hydratase/isomerase family protein [Nannocystis radixulma]MDC0675238.1 enoyl-CoA hydratase/isomerase family protein [Nannocystis radixulma]
MRDEPGRLIETVLAPGIVRWTISHPRKRNALTPAMLAAIEAGARALRGEIVVLDAAADPCFCAGFDLDALPEGQVDAPAADAPDAPLITASAALQTCDALVVAVVHGEVFGAGVELVAACDVRLAAPGVRFTVPAARLGVVYHAAGVALLRRVFGPALARRMLLAADGITAEEAHRAGALTGLHPPDELARAGEELAARLRRGAPQSLRAHRDLLRALDRGGPTAEELAAHERARRVAYTSDDFREGRAAARERRSPRFRGG